MTNTTAYDGKKKARQHKRLLLHNVPVEWQKIIENPSSARVTLIKVSELRDLNQ